MVVLLSRLASREGTPLTAVPTALEPNPGNRVRRAACQGGQGRCPHRLEAHADLNIRQGKTLVLESTARMELEKQNGGRRVR